MTPTTVVAEIGVNHNGDVRLAKALVRQAVDAGADVVKLQTFNTKKLASPTALQAPYQLSGTQGSGSQREMLAGLELSKTEHVQVKHLAEQLGIEFLSTPFDSESLHFLVQDLKLRTIKIGSGDVTNLPLIMKVGALQCKLILSTGMSTMLEIHEALSSYLFGLEYPNRQPDSLGEVLQSVDREESRQILARNVTLLHCTSEYPALMKDMNLRVMKGLSDSTGLQVGLSDHSEGIEATLAAVALGAVMVEKHLTLDTRMVGPDHAASLNGEQFEQMVIGIRKVEEALGDSVKKPLIGEEANRSVARRGLYASRKIKRGQTISADDLDVLRPLSESQPREYWDWIGVVAVEDLAAGQALPSVATIRPRNQDPRASSEHL